MEFRAANEQQQEALWRVFLMFVAMALLIIRTGLVSRGWSPSSAQSAPQDAASPLDHQPSSPSPEELYQATLAAVPGQAVGRLFVLNTREVWELMNQPLPRPASGPLSSANLCERPGQRLDSPDYRPVLKPVPGP
jgi:hypothetical protein